MFLWGWGMVSKYFFYIHFAPLYFFIFFFGGYFLGFSILFCSSAVCSVLLLGHKMNNRLKGFL